MSKVTLYGTQVQENDVFCAPSRRRNQRRAAIFFRLLRHTSASRPCTLSRYSPLYQRVVLGVSKGLVQKLLEYLAYKSPHFPIGPHPVCSSLCLTKMDPESGLGCRIGSIFDQQRSPCYIFWTLEPSPILGNNPRSRVQVSGSGGTGVGAADGGALQLTHITKIIWRLNRLQHSRACPLVRKATSFSIFLCMPCGLSNQPHVTICRCLAVGARALGPQTAVHCS